MLKVFKAIIKIIFLVVAVLLAVMVYQCATMKLPDNKQLAQETMQTTQSFFKDYSSSWNYEDVTKYLSPQAIKFNQKFDMKAMSAEFSKLGKFVKIATAAEGTYKAVKNGEGTIIYYMNSYKLDFTNGPINAVMYFNKKDNGKWLIDGYNLTKDFDLKKE